MSGYNKYTVNDDTLKNQRRERMEQGPGGDHDEPFQYVPLDKSAGPLRAILKALRAVVEGRVGGPEDGNEEDS